MWSALAAVKMLAATAKELRSLPNGSELLAAITDSALAAVKVSGDGFTAGVIARRNKKLKSPDATMKRLNPHKKDKALSAQWRAGFLRGWTADERRTAERLKWELRYAQARVIADDWAKMAEEEKAETAKAAA